MQTLPMQLLEAIALRAQTNDVQFRVVVPNPARAELHLLHPERHDKAHEAELVLRQAQPLLEAAAGGPVIGTVSVRNDPMDAIEETIFSEPIHEIMLGGCAPRVLEQTAPGPRTQAPTLRPADHRREDRRGEAMSASRRMRP